MAYPKNHIPWNKGKKGLQNGWNKGLTKLNHPGIMKDSLSKIADKNSMWKGGVDSSDYIFRLVYEEYNKPKKCEMCGTDQGKIEIHHQDKDRRNNDINNLLVVCSMCHHSIIHKQIPKGKVIQCDICGEEKYYYPYEVNKKNHYCSNKCVGIAKRK
jgi:hypothetical protein